VLENVPMRGRTKLRILIGPYCGQVLEYSDVAAQSLLDSGYAELPGEPKAVASEPAPDLETATLPEVETADLPRPRRARKA